MLADFPQEPAAVEQDFDVAVIGGGAVGISLVRKLMKAGRRVCLIESGGLDFDRQTQALYEGRNVGQPYYDLEQSRLRFLGGTTAIWGGRCARLNPIDLRHREWVEHSGWPIEHDEIERWYRHANAEFGLSEADWQNAPFVHQSGQYTFDPDRLATSYWLFDDLTERFTSARLRDLIEAPNVLVLLNANATQISLSDDASHTSSIKLQSLGRRSAMLRAKHFVLTCGAIENARLLMASTDVMSAGIANEHDQLGRYFMEHPNGRLGEIVTPRPYALWAAFQKRFPGGAPPSAPVLRLSSREQAEQQALNSAVTFKLQYPPARGRAFSHRVYNDVKHSLNPDNRGRRFGHAYRKARAIFHRTVRGPLEFVRSSLRLTHCYAMIRGEQAPNPESRVVLSSERDALGHRRGDLDWRLCEIDKHTANALADALDKELRRLGLGHLERAEWLGDSSTAWPIDPSIGNHHIGGYHHMGGTRMSETSRTGIVDSNCKVHGVANLHIAGSSVFPTGGWANPTFTAMALALRLADRLDRNLGRA